MHALEKYYSELKKNCDCTSVYIIKINGKIKRDKNGDIDKYDNEKICDSVCKKVGGIKHKINTYTQKQETKYRLC